VRFACCALEAVERQGFVEKMQTDRVRIASVSSSRTIVQTENTIRIDADEPARLSRISQREQGDVSDATHLCIWAVVVEAHLQYRIVVSEDAVIFRCEHRAKNKQCRG